MKAGIEQEKSGKPNYHKMPEINPASGIACCFYWVYRFMVQGRGEKGGSVALPPLPRTSAGARVAPQRCPILPQMNANIYQIVKNAMKFTCPAHSVSTLTEANFLS